MGSIRMNSVMSERTNGDLIRLFSQTLLLFDGEKAIIIVFMLK